MDLTKVILVAAGIVVALVLLYLYVHHLFEEGYEEEEVRLHVFGDVPLALLDRLKPGYKYRSEPKPYREDPPEYMEASCDSEMHHDDPLIASLMNASAVDMKRNSQTIGEGGWRCACGKVHARYTSSCSCGRNKGGALPPQPAVREIDNETKNAAAIREYKRLMDDGIITPEEFEAKKKQLLGI